MDPGSAINQPNQTIKEYKWLADFWFVQAADTQYGMIDAAFNGGDYGWEKEIILTQKAIQIANNLNPLPKFFVVCGDMVHAYPGEKNKDLQIIDFKKTFKQLNPSIPLICVCGNHDIGNIPTEAAILDYRKSFGDDFFSFWISGVKFIVLNSQYYFDSTYVPKFQKSQEMWLIEELKDAKANNATHIIIFQHIPWFLNDPSENNVYYEYGGKQGLFNIDKTIRFQMMKLFKEYNVTKIFCGHYHRNAGGWDENIEVITSSAVGCQLGTDKSGMRIVKVYQNEVMHKYYEFESFSNQPYHDLFPKL